MAAGERGANTERPWPITTLVVLSVAGLTYDFVTLDATELPFTLVALVLGALITWGLWMGRDWARFWTLVGCYAVLLFSIVAAFFWRDIPLWNLLWGLGVAGVFLWLAHHPETRRHCRTRQSIIAS